MESARLNYLSFSILFNNNENTQSNFIAKFTEQNFTLVKNEHRQKTIDVSYDINTKTNCLDVKIAKKEEK